MYTMLALRSAWGLDLSRFRLGFIETDTLKEGTEVKIINYICVVAVAGTPDALLLRIVLYSYLLTGAIVFFSFFF